MEATTDARRCVTCGQKKPLTEYYRDYGRGDGYARKCKPCAARYQADYKRRIKESARIAADAADAADDQVVIHRGGAHDTNRTADGIERDHRSRELAMLGASLARLRKAINRWWKDSGEGQETATGASLLAVRVALRSAAEEDQRILRRRGKR